MKKQSSFSGNTSVALPEQCFWVHHGPVLSSVQELRDALPLLSNEQFEYHVNEEKHDFAQWIESAIGDKELAKKVQKSTTKRGLARLLTLHAQSHS
ncbi:MAG: hypothetical protein Q8P70_02200 [bacterium]|nr:hypothetical protein [bacterium]